MSAKTLPLPAAELEALTQTYPTPFYLYDEAQIRARVRALQQAFSWNPGFKQHFAVKALPNPTILQILREEGSGVDCASLTELMLAERAGITGSDIMFTSSDTPAADEQLAVKLGATINFDGPAYIDFVQEVAGIPETVCVRYSPLHEIERQNNIMGGSGESKFGMRRDQIFGSLARLRDLGAQKFGVHSMLASNSLNPDYYPQLAELLFKLTVEVKQELGISLSFLNFAGGLGIPYHPEENELDLAQIGRAVQERYQAILGNTGLRPAILTELGRYITGPAGYLVTRVLHQKETYKRYVGVDACSVNLLRPAMYGAYHHASVVGKEQTAATERYDVVGSLCENNDKLATSRELPPISVGDLLVLHDVGAHGFSMGYNYNGRLKCAEVLLREDGTTQLIRRAETPEDYFATLNF